MKRKHLFITASLSILLGLGVAAGATTLNTDKKVEKVEAATTNTVYYALDSNTASGKNMKVWIYYDHPNTDEGVFGMSQVGKYGDYILFSCTFTDKYNGVGWLQFQCFSGNTYQWGDTRLNSSWHGTSEFNGKMCIASGASWQSIYLVTYYPNGASGSTTKRAVLSSNNYTIASYSDVGISSHVYKHAVKWGINSTGTGTSYQPGANYTAKTNLDLYFIEDWYTYQFKINSGSWNTLTKTNDTPSGYVAQFVSASFSFTSGDTVSFQKYYGSESPTSITPSAYEETSNVKNGVALYSTSGKVYLKVTDSNGHTVYAEGFSDRGIVISRGGHEYKCACTPKTTTGQNQEWEVSNITLLPGDTLKGTYKGGTAYTLYIENTDVFGITSAGVVSTPGVYMVYLKSYDYGSNFPNAYLGMNDTATGKLIAQTFNDALTTVCNSTVAGGATSQITSAFSTQKNYYDHLTSTCKTLVATGSTSDSDILAMRTKYDYIVSKYGTTIAPNYLGRSITPRSLQYINLVIFGQGENPNSVLAIILVSTATALSVCGYFLLRKKKQK